MKKLTVYALAFSLAANPVSFGQDRPFAYDGAAHEQYLKGKLDATKLEPREINNFIQNVFDFQKVAGADSERAWKAAADASIALVTKSRAAFETLECQARMSINNRLVIVIPSGARGNDRQWPANSDFTAKLETLNERLVAHPACKINRA